jgi:hypothetical protein
MKTLLRYAAVIACVISASTASAQYVKGNEAVQQLANGKTRVQTAPLTNAASRRTPCPASGGCHPGPWHMVETKAGLLECTEVYARESTCRPSTYGAQKLGRLWVVKSKGEWQKCQFPDLKSKCVPVFARPPANLPYSAVQ